MKIKAAARRAAAPRPQRSPAAPGMRPGGRSRAGARLGAARRTAAAPDASNALPNGCSAAALGFPLTIVRL